MIPILLGGALLSGCVSCAKRGALEDGGLDVGREADFYWGENTYLTFNRPGAGTPEFWCAKANDPSLSRLKRRLAVGMLFGLYVKPDFTTDEMRTAIPDPAWLKECTLAQSIGGTGPPLYVYSYLNANAGIFTLNLFPDQKDVVGWVIGFVIVSPSQPWRTLGAEAEAEAAAFLRGEHPDKTLRLAEFVMGYSLPGCEPGSTVLEAHTPRGVGIEVMPIHPFGEE